MRASACLALAALLALAAGCRSTGSCKAGTLLLTVELGAGTEQAARVSVRVAMTGGALIASGEVERPAGQSRGTIEVGFRDGYPASQDVTVTVAVRARTGDTVPVASRSLTLRLAPGCSTLAFSLLAGDGGADTRDATGDLPADRPDGPPADGTDAAVPEADGPGEAPLPPDAAPDAEVDRAPDGEPDGAEPDAPAEPDVAPPEPDGPPSGNPVKHVFVTSTRHTGNVGGVAGAHAICQQLADDAGLVGTFRAWLSEGLSGPAGSMVHSSVPYELVGGERVASSWNDLVDGTIERAIEQDERGRKLNPEPMACEGGEVWTNTTAAGGAIFGLGTDCSGWQGTGGNSRTGNMRRKDDRWTDSGCSTSCLTDLPFYCFEQ